MDEDMIQGKKKEEQTGSIYRSLPEGLGE
jgi:hypothetical protein